MAEPGNAGDFKTFINGIETSASRFRTNIDAIIQKYNKPFDNDDVIDLSTLSIIKDRGYIRSIKGCYKFGTAHLKSTKRKDELLQRQIGLSETHIDPNVSMAITRQYNRHLQGSNVGDDEPSDAETLDSDSSDEDDNEKGDDEDACGDNDEDFDADKRDFQNTGGKDPERGEVCDLLEGHPSVDENNVTCKRRGKRFSRSRVRRGGGKGQRVHLNQSRTELARSGKGAQVHRSGTGRGGGGSDDESESPGGCYKPGTHGTAVASGSRAGRVKQGGRSPGRGSRSAPARQGYRGTEWVRQSERLRHCGGTQGETQGGQQHLHRNGAEWVSSKGAERTKKGKLLNTLSPTGFNENTEKRLGKMETGVASESGKIPRDKIGSELGKNRKLQGDKSSTQVIIKCRRIPLSTVRAERDDSRRRQVNESRVEPGDDRRLPHENGTERLNSRGRQISESSTEQAESRRRQISESGTEQADTRRRQTSESGTEPADTRRRQISESGTEPADARRRQTSESGTEPADIRRRQISESETERFKEMQVDPPGKSQRKLGNSTGQEVRLARTPVPVASDCFNQSDSASSITSSLRNLTFVSYESPKLAKTKEACVKLKSSNLFNNSHLAVFRNLQSELNTTFVVDNSAKPVIKASEDFDPLDRIMLSPSRKKSGQVLQKSNCEPVCQNLGVEGCVNMEVTLVKHGNSNFCRHEEHDHESLTHLGSNGRKSKDNLQKKISASAHQNLQIVNVCQSLNMETILKKAGLFVEAGRCKGIISASLMNASSVAGEYEDDTHKAKLATPCHNLAAKHPSCDNTRGTSVTQTTGYSLTADVMSGDLDSLDSSCEVKEHKTEFHKSSNSRIGHAKNASSSKRAAADIKISSRHISGSGRIKNATTSQNASTHFSGSHKNKDATTSQSPSTHFSGSDRIKDATTSQSPSTRFSGSDRIKDATTSQSPSTHFSGSDRIKDATTSQSPSTRFSGSDRIKDATTSQSPSTRFSGSDRIKNATTSQSPSTRFSGSDRIKNATTSQSTSTHFSGSDRIKNATTSQSPSTRFSGSDRIKDATTSQSPSTHFSGSDRIKDATTSQSPSTHFSGSHSKNPAASCVSNKTFTNESINNSTHVYNLREMNSQVNCDESVSYSLEDMDSISSRVNDSINVYNLHERKSCIHQQSSSYSSEEISLAPERINNSMHVYNLRQRKPSVDQKESNCQSPGNVSLTSSLRNLSIQPGTSSPRSKRTLLQSSGTLAKSGLPAKNSIMSLPQSDLPSKNSVMSPPHSGFLSKNSIISPPHSGFPSKNPIMSPPHSGLPSKNPVMSRPHSGLPSKNPIMSPPHSGLPSKNPVMSPPQSGLSSKNPIMSPPQSGLPSKNSSAYTTHPNLLPQCSKLFQQHTVAPQCASLSFPQTTFPSQGTSLSPAKSTLSRWSSLLTAETTVIHQPSSSLPPQPTLSQCAIFSSPHPTLSQRCIFSSPIPNTQLSHSILVPAHFSTASTSSNLEFPPGKQLHQNSDLSSHQFKHPPPSSFGSPVSRSHSNNKKTSTSQAFSSPSGNSVDDRGSYQRSVSAESEAWPCSCHHCCHMFLLAHGFDQKKWTCRNDVPVNKPNNGARPIRGQLKRKASGSFTSGYVTETSPSPKHMKTCGGSLHNNQLVANQTCTQPTACFKYFAEPACLHGRVQTPQHSLEHYCLCQPVHNKYKMHRSDGTFHHPTRHIATQTASGTDENVSRQLAVVKKRRRASVCRSGNSGVCSQLPGEGKGYNGYSLYQLASGRTCCLHQASQTGSRGCDWEVTSHDQQRSPQVRISPRVKKSQVKTSYCCEWLQVGKHTNPRKNPVHCPSICPSEEVRCAPHRPSCVQPPQTKHLKTGLKSTDRNSTTGQKQNLSSSQYLSENQVSLHMHCLCNGCVKKDCVNEKDFVAENGCAVENESVAESDCITENDCIVENYSVENDSVAEEDCITENDCIVENNYVAENDSVIHDDCVIKKDQINKRVHEVWREIQADQSSAVTQPRHKEGVSNESCVSDSLSEIQCSESHNQQNERLDMPITPGMVQGSREENSGLQESRILWNASYSTHSDLPSFVENHSPVPTSKMPAIQSSKPKVRLKSKMFSESFIEQFSPLNPLRKDSDVTLLAYEQTKFAAESGLEKYINSRSRKHCQKKSIVSSDSNQISSRVDGQTMLSPISRKIRSPEQSNIVLSSPVSTLSKTFNVPSSQTRSHAYFDPAEYTRRTMKPTGHKAGYNLTPHDEPGNNRASTPIRALYGMPDFSLSDSLSTIVDVDATEASDRGSDSESLEVSRGQLESETLIADSDSDEDVDLL